MKNRYMLFATLAVFALLLTACAPAGVDEAVVAGLEDELAAAEAALAEAEAAGDDVADLEAQLEAAQAELEAAMVVEEEPEELVDLEFRLNWTLYGEHAPFFVGVDKGFYAEEGLNVTIAEGSGSATTVKLVANGTNLIGYADGGTVVNAIARSGVPVRAVATLLQTHPMSFIYRADAARPTSLDDLPGTTIAITAGDASLATLDACLGKNGLSQDDIELVVVSNPAAKETAVLEGTVDTFMGYYIDQPMRMEKNTGVEINWSVLSDLCNVSTLSSSIIVSDPVLKTQPELVSKFVRATQRAVQYTMDNPEEAAAIFAVHAADFGFDEELSLREIEGALALLHTPNSEGQPIGWSSPVDWNATNDLFAEYTPGYVPVEDVSIFFTNDFISEAPYLPGE